MEDHPFIFDVCVEQIEGLMTGEEHKAKVFTKIRKTHPLAPSLQEERE